MFDPPRCPASQTPELTVAIPFLNNAGTLPLAIRSVFAQSFTNWQLLLIDDGSTDGSDELALNDRGSRPAWVSCSRSLPCAGRARWQTEKLVHRRGTSLPPEMIKTHSQIIATIAETPVPGWDTPLA